MIDITYDVFDEGINRSLERLAAATGREVGRMIRDRTPALGRYLAEATQPIAGMDTTTPDGGSAKARDLGRGAVQRDLRRVYVSSSAIYDALRKTGGAGQAVARAFYKKLKAGDLEGARQIMVRMGRSEASLTFANWDGGARHKRMRNSRGRVNKGNKPEVIGDFKAVKDYGKKVEKRVGFAKSGWINAAKQVKTGGTVSAWIRNNTGPGMGQDETRDTDSPRVRLTNNVRYVSSILTEGNRIRAVNAFERSLTKEAEIALEYLARKEAALANAATSAGARMAA